jgi:hypothetical protein
MQPEPNGSADRPMGAVRAKNYDGADAMDAAARRALSARVARGGPTRRAHSRGTPAMSPVVLELGLLVLTAVSFWLLDRYVIGCEKI